MWNSAFCFILTGFTGSALAGSVATSISLDGFCARDRSGDVTSLNVANPVIVPAGAARRELLPRHRKFPNDRNADLLWVKDPASTASSSKLTYKVLVLDAAGERGTPSNVLSVSEGIELAATDAVPKSTDFSSTNDKREKTLVTFRMSVPEKPLTATEGWYRAVDVYVLGCSQSAQPSTLQAYGYMRSTVSSRIVCRTFAVAFLLCAYLCAVLSVSTMRRKKLGAQPKANAPGRVGSAVRTPGFLNHLDPIVLAAGDDGKGSVAKLQMLFFSMIVLWLVFYIWLMTEHLSDLSETVLLLMGITGIGSTAAAGAELSRNRLSLENWAWLVGRGWLPRGGMATINTPRWRDILTTNEVFDVPRFQLVTFSIVVGLGLLATGTDLADLSTYSIPTPLLSILGLSQVVYVAGKLVGPQSVRQLDDQLSQVRDAEVDFAKVRRAYRQAAALGVITAEQKKTFVEAAVAYALVEKLARTSFVSVYPVCAERYFST